MEKALAAIEYGGAGVRPDSQDGSTLMGRVDRCMTTGCVTVLTVLAVVLAIGLSCLWYTDWHAGKVNRERRDSAESSIIRQTREAADATVRSLDASHAEDVDKLTMVIGKHTAAPLVAYDASRREFTARLPQRLVYETAGVLGGGSDMVNRCFDITYSRPYGQAWTSKVTERSDGVCGPASEIGYLARRAKTRIEGVDARSLNRTGVRKALDPTGTLRTFAVKDVTRGDGAVVVSLLISSRDAAAGQCYRITRPAPDADGDHRASATASPAAAC
ncbi:hypothetical protein [Streptomyces varsoviensis]|nr:hypothetical protein [Streptomyces varsoviensis]